MPRTVCRAVLFPLLCALLLTAPACRKKPMMPVMDQAAAVTLFGTLQLEMRHLDRETRASYLEQVAGQAADPFAPDNKGREAFLVFLFSVENRGDAAALISPGFASLVDRRGKLDLRPLDARELGTILAANPAFSPAVAQRLHPATFNINPGQRLSKLLVFPATDRTPPAVELVLPSVISGTLSADARFPFDVNWSPVSSRP